MESPFSPEQGYTIYGGLFPTQDEAQNNLRTFADSGKYELHPEVHPILRYREDHDDFKLSIVARKK